MRRVVNGFIALTLLIAVSALHRGWTSPQSAPIDYASTPPLQVVKEVPKGQLHNPYKDTDKDIVAQGRTQFNGYSCSGCHGGDGGGGMCPPLTNGVWIYGGDDDTLFRLVTLGSVQLQKEGYTAGFGAGAGPMPSMGPLFKNSDDLWKILAFIRSRYDGDPAYKYGAPASQK